MPRSYHHWSDEELATLSRLYLIERLSRARIAEVLGVSPLAVRAKLHVLGARRNPGWQPRQCVAVVRYRLRCLCCGGMFWSRDKARQRVCSRCKTRETWQFGGAEMTL